MGGALLRAAACHATRAPVLVLSTVSTPLQVAGVQYILDTVVQALQANPHRKFVYAEMVRSGWPAPTGQNTAGACWCLCFAATFQPLGAMSPACFLHK